MSNEIKELFKKDNEKYISDHEQWDNDLSNLYNILKSYLKEAEDDKQLVFRVSNFPYSAWAEIFSLSVDIDIFVDYNKKKVQLCIMENTKSGHEIYLKDGVWSYLDMEGYVPLNEKYFFEMLSNLLGSYES